MELWQFNACVLGFDRAQDTVLGNLLQQSYYTAYYNNSSKKSPAKPPEEIYKKTVRLRDRHRGKKKKTKDDVNLDLQKIEAFKKQHEEFQREYKRLRGDIDV